MNDDEVFLLTIVEPRGLASPSYMVHPSSEPNLIGAIALDDKKYVIAIQGYDCPPKSRATKK